MPFPAKSRQQRQKLSAARSRTQIKQQATQTRSYGDAHADYALVHTSGVIRLAEPVYPIKPPFLTCPFFRTLVKTKSNCDSSENVIFLRFFKQTLIKIK